MILFCSPKYFVAFLPISASLHVGGILMLTDSSIPVLSLLAQRPAFQGNLECRGGILSVVFITFRDSEGAS